MRTAFIDMLCSLAAEDERIRLFCGDLGYSVLERFAYQLPSRFLNAGVAEQNTTGIAAGLALSGKTVFTYSIANFPVMRCLEQIRNDVCYHNLNVKIVAVGGGLAYGSHGYTHHGVEDMAVMSAMPNLCVAAPGDPVEARGITSILALRRGPSYLRLGKAGEPRLHEDTVRVEYGRAISVVEGSHITLISIGGMLGTTLHGAEILLQRGVRAWVLSMLFLVPLDRQTILDASRSTAGIVTVEEHEPGGLGTAVAEVLAEVVAFTRFRALRLRREPIKVSGTQEGLRAEQGLLRAEGITKAAELLLRTTELEATH